jgi:hypothetical protein
MDDDATTVVRLAERIVFRASWRLREQAALHRLSSTHGLCREPLEPRSDVIQLVAFDGEHLGHIRRERLLGQRESWVAVLRQQGTIIGSYPRAEGAAEALAQACGVSPRPG